MTKLSPADRARRSRSHGRSHGRSHLGMVTGWVGWISFAAILLILLGFFQAIEGLVALFNSDFYLVAPSGLVVDVDFTTWGWVLLITGLLAFGTGFGLLAGNIVARVLGIAFAALSAVVHLVFIAAFPLWAAVVITIDVIVIYAIAVHGHEVRN
jgi:hypothetical protein